MWSESRLSNTYRLLLHEEKPAGRQVADRQKLIFSDPFKHKFYRREFFSAVPAAGARKVLFFYGSGPIGSIY